MKIQQKLTTPALHSNVFAGQEGVNYLLYILGVQDCNYIVAQPTKTLKGTPEE